MFENVTDSSNDGYIQWSNPAKIHPTQYYLILANLNKTACIPNFNFLGYLEDEDGETKTKTDCLLFTGLVVCRISI